jgi:hypothetical protein
MVLNAITEKTFDHNNTNTATSQGVIEPLTNYNVIVLDQRFRQNSSYRSLILMCLAMEALEMQTFQRFDLRLKASHFKLMGDTIQLMI